MSAMAARIGVDGLGVSFGGKPVLDGLSFTVAAGSVVRVAGRNGAGKTTLLGVLAGLVPPDVGDVRVESATRSPGDRLPLLASPPQLFPYLSVTEHLRMAGQLSAARHDDDFVLVDPAALGLGAVSSSLAETLSLGQRQRLALGMLRTTGSDIWLMDEPFNGLDDDGVVALREEIASVAARGGIVVVVAHQSAHVRGIATSTLGLDDVERAEAR